METKIKKGLLLFIVVILLLPLLQHSFSIIVSGPLNGLYAEVPDTAFSLKKWLNGSYQHQKELYLNEKTGFRPDMVRLNNQIDFSLFDKCHSGWTILVSCHA